MLGSKSNLASLAAVLPLALTLCACAGAQEKSTADKVAAERPAAASDKGAGDKPSADAKSAAPSAASPAATSAGGLRIIDTKVGTGKEAQAGKAALLQYTGWLYDEKSPDNKGKQFDSSLARGGLPFGFIIGVGRVIKGWDQGIVGMKVGGTRTLIVPPALGYGDKEAGNGSIPANSTLLFEIELVDIKP